MVNFKYTDVARKALEIARRSGGRLPSERSLCEICGISRITGKKALNYLKDRGLVTRHKRKGSFLAEGKTAPKVSFLMVAPNTPEEMRAYFQREAEFFLGPRNCRQIDFSTIGDEKVVSHIYGHGTKIIYWPYVGRLSNLGAFSDFDELPGFDEVCTHMDASLCDWHRSLEGIRRCTAIPLHFGVNIFAFNRRFAKKLGLDTNTGPRTWDDIIEWGERCALDSTISSTGGFHPKQPLPYSYYLTASGGLEYLTETPEGLKFNFPAGAGWFDLFRRLYALPNVYEMSTPTPGPDPLTRNRALFSCEVGPWIQCHRGTRLGDALVTRPIPAAMPGGISCPRIGKYCVAMVPGGDADGVALAWAFIKHLLCDADAQRRLLTTNHIIAANKTVRDEQAARPEWKIFIDAFHAGKALSSHPVMFGLTALLKESFTDCVTGRIEPEEAAAKVQEFGNLLIKIERERTWF